MAELSAAVRPNAPSGGTSKSLNYPFGGVSCPDTNPKNIFGKDASDEERGRLMLAKLTEYPILRKSLQSINTARAYKYGSKSFGERGWYTENFDVVKNLHSNMDRRKFRFGLKSNIDFLIQLDLENLKSCLIDKSLDQNFHHVDQAASLSDGSFLSLMQQMNLSKAQKFCRILKRMESNLNFTQSLSEHFANDEMLEPALMVVSDVLRQSPDLGEGLWGRSVAANALLYRHRASPRDREFKSEISNPRTTQFSLRPQTRPQKRNFIGYRPPNPSYTKPKYPIGSCFRFQSTGRCDIRGCTYDHACCKCFSKTHGKDFCPDN